MKPNKTPGDRLSNFKHNPQGTRGVLASIFKEMALSANLQDLGTWNAMMTRFIDDPINAIPTGKKARSSARGNLTKELTKNHLSWNVFCNKAMRFLDLIGFKITITAYRRGKNNTVTETVHERTIHLRVPLTDEEYAAQQAYEEEKASRAEAVKVTNAEFKPFDANLLGLDPEFSVMKIESVSTF